MMFANSRTRILDAFDGSSNTLLIGERPPSADMVYGWWYAGAGQRLPGQLDSHLGMTEINYFGILYRGCPRDGYSFQPRERGDHCTAYQFWSLHPGGAHFAMTDGSLHFLKYDASSIMPALATRVGGEVASLPQ